MLQWPLPSENAAPVAKSETVYLGPEEQAVVEFSPNLSGTEFRTPVVSISKLPDSTYEIKMDDRTVWGPSRFPPTDIDDTSAVWIPARAFESSLTVKATNLRTSGGERRYDILPIGWEEP